MLTTEGARQILTRYKIWPVFLSESKIRREAVKFALNLPSHSAKFSAKSSNFPLGSSGLNLAKSIKSVHDFAAMFSKT